MKWQPTFVFLTSFLLLSGMSQQASAQYLDPGEQMMVTVIPAPFDFQAPATQQALPTNYLEVCQLIEYPQIAVDAGIEGMVQVRVLIDESGNMMDHFVMSSPHEMLSQAVAAKLDELQFQPASLEGKAVVSWLSLRFSFEATE